MSDTFQPSESSGVTSKRAQKAIGTRPVTISRALVESESDVFPTSNHRATGTDYQITEIGLPFQYRCNSGFTSSIYPSIPDFRLYKLVNPCLSSSSRIAFALRAPDLQWTTTFLSRLILLMCSPSLLKGINVAPMLTMSYSCCSRTSIRSKLSPRSCQSRNSAMDISRTGRSTALAPQNCS